MRDNYIPGLAAAYPRSDGEGMTGFIIRTGITAVALWVAVSIVPGLAAHDAGTLVLAALLLGLVNATLRPVAVILSIPATILTFGLFLLVVNAAMLGLVAALLPSFTVSGFWAALFGAVVVSIVSGFINRAARGD
jgi:putative membrane protein